MTSCVIEYVNVYRHLFKTLTKFSLIFQSKVAKVAQVYILLIYLKVIWPSTFIGLVYTSKIKNKSKNINKNIFLKHSNNKNDEKQSYEIKHFVDKQSC